MNMKEACATFPHGSTVLVAAGQDDAVGRVVGYPWRRKWSPDNDPDMISVEFTLAEKWKLVKSVTSTSPREHCRSTSPSIGSGLGLSAKAHRKRFAESTDSA